MSKPDPKLYTVRGITYAKTVNARNIKLKDMLELYLVIRAIEGDKLAEEILNSAGCVVMDVHGNQVWPILQQG